MSAFARHGIDHLSASHLNLFISQPALWAVSYLLKKRTPVGPAAHRGSAIEYGVELGLFDPAMPIADCQQAALGRYHSLTRLSADPRVEKERECIPPSVDIALCELRPYGIPEKAESARQHRIEINLPGIAIPVIGFLDFDFAAKGIIVDLKSTARIPSEMSDAHAMQGAIYQEARGNHEIRFAYVSAKKVSVLPLVEPKQHLWRALRAAQAIERLLSLSDDPEQLTRCFMPDLSSFHWGDASARALAHEIWAMTPEWPATAEVVDW